MHLSIYPNPISASGHLKIEVPEDQQVHVAVRDMKGRIITQKKVFVCKGEATISLYSYSWKAGLYFIQCSNEKGDHRQVKVLKIR